MNHSLEFVNTVTGACTNEIEGCWTLSKLHCPQFNRHWAHFEGDLFNILLWRIWVLNVFFFKGYLAHYVVKRHFKFFKDPFSKFFREGVHCWIPLADRPIVQFEFDNSHIEDPNELEEIREKMKKYLEEKIVKSVKRKQKRQVWREKMKRISDEQDIEKKKKEKKKVQKMTKKKREEYYEKLRKNAEKKNSILAKRLSAKRVRAALEFSRAQSLLSDEVLRSSVTNYEGEDCSSPPAGPSKKRPAEDRLPTPRAGPAKKRSAANCLPTTSAGRANERSPDDCQ